MQNIKKYIKYLVEPFNISIIFLLSFAIIAPPLLTGSWTKTHEFFRYLYLFDQFRDVFYDGGILYPRWLPDTYGGYGYPLFVFYQPGFFFFSLPFSLLTQNIMIVMHLTVTFLLFAGGLGVYLTTKKLADRITGLFCGIFFLLTPYLYVNLYVRGDLSELAAMLLTPWPLYFLLLLKDKVEKEKRIAPTMGFMSVFLCFIIISHPATALFYVPVFVLIFFYISFNENREKQKIFLLAVGFSTLLGLALSSPYWLTVFMMKKHVTCEFAFAEYFSAEKHLVQFPQFFSTKWGFGASGEKVDDMSFQLGLIHFILAFAGFLANRKNRWIQACFATYIMLIFAMCPLSSFFWKHIQLMRFAQFPWRILSVTAVLQCICISGVSKLIKNKTNKNKWQKIIFYATAIILFIFWNKSQFDLILVSSKYTIYRIKEERTIRLNNGFVYQASNETMPKTVKVRPPKGRGNAPLVQVSSPNCVIQELPGHSKYHIFYALTPFEPMKMMINQLYFPGLKVFLDGSSLSDAEMRSYLTPDGRMLIDIKPGQHTLEVYYDGPPGWKIRNVVIGLILMAYLIFLAKEDRKFRQEKKQRQEAL